MRWNDIYVAGLGSDLPPAVSVESAVQDGLVTAERAEELGYVSVLVSEGAAGPEMAVEAGKQAVARSGVDPDQFGLALHSYLWWQGRGKWATASYVSAKSLDRVNAPAYDILQRCNGGVGSLDLAAGFLAGGARGTAALLTTGDRFVSPAVDRYNTHGKLMYGDGGTAMVLAKGHGFARVLSSVTRSDNHFEGMSRGTSPLDECPPDPSVPLDLSVQFREFSAEQDANEIYTRLFGTIHAARDGALADAGAKLGDIKVVADAATRGGIDSDLYLQLYGFTAEQSCWDFGRRTGHVGSGDQFAGFEDAITSGKLAPGDLVLLFGGGAGFTCTAVVVEMLEIPSY